MRLLGVLAIAHLLQCLLNWLHGLIHLPIQDIGEGLDGVVGVGLEVNLHVADELRQLLVLVGFDRGGGHGEVKDEEGTEAPVALEELEPRWQQT